MARLSKSNCLTGLSGGSLFLPAAISVYIFNNRPPRIIIPTHSVPVPNAYDGFVSAGRLAKNVIHQSPAQSGFPPSQSETLANLEACTRELAPAHAALRVALRQHYMYPPVRSMIDPLQQNNTPLRELCRELQGEALYYKKIGKAGNAVDALLDGAEMGAVLPHGGGIMPSLVGEACEGICISQVEPLLPSMTSSGLKIVAGRIQRILERRATFAEVMVEASNVETALFVEGLHDPNGYGSYKAVLELDYMDDWYKTSRPSKLSHHLRTAGFMVSNKEELARANQRYCLSLANEARNPYIGNSRVPRPNNIVAEFWEWMYNTHRPRNLRTRMILTLLQLEVALDRYHSDNGGYPTKLSTLVPNYIARIPDDLFAGKAGKSPIYRTIRHETAYLLYSFGEDLKDDAGQPCNPYSGRGGQGDLVAGYLASPERKPK